MFWGNSRNLWFWWKKCGFCPKRINKKIFFCQKCSLSNKKHNNENRPSVKRTWQILCIQFWTFLLLNAICLGICNSLLDFILKGHSSRLSAQIWMGVFSFAFAFMWTKISDKNQKFEIFGQKHVCPSANLSVSIPFTFGESRSDGRRYRLAVYPTKTHKISSAHIIFFCCKDAYLY